LQGTLINEGNGEIGVLYSNKRPNTITSYSGAFEFQLQENGNIVLLKNDNVVWESKTIEIGTGPWILKLEPKNGMVLFDSLEKVVWSSYTTLNKESSYLVVDGNSGNLVYYDFLGSFQQSILRDSPFSFSSLSDTNNTSTTSVGTTTGVQCPHVLSRLDDFFVIFLVIVASFLFVLVFVLLGIIYRLSRGRGVYSQLKADPFQL